MTFLGNNRVGQTDLNRVTFGLLWVFIFCVPWEEEVPLPGQIALSHYVGAGAASAGLLYCVQCGSLRRPHLLHYLLGVFVIWAAASYSWSIDTELTTVRVGSYIQLLLMVWLIWQFAGSFDRQLQLFAAYILGCWVSAGSTLYSFVTGTGTNLGLVEGRYTALGANENELGIIFALGIAMAAYLAPIYQRFSVVWFVSVPLFFVSILLTGSRGSFLSSIIALFLLPLTLMRFSVASRIVSALTLIFLMAAGVALMPPSTWERVRTIPTELAQGSLTKRTYIWTAGLEVYREHPVLGVGAGAFEASVYKRLDIPYVAHNSYLSVLVELGIVGIILFGTFLCSLAYCAISLPKPSRAAWSVLLLTWGVAVSSVTWEHRKPTWFLFGMLAAQCAALTNRNFDDHETAAPMALPLDSTSNYSLRAHLRRSFPL